MKLEYGPNVNVANRRPTRSTDEGGILLWYRYHVQFERGAAAAQAALQEKLIYAPGSQMDDDGLEHMQ